ncbi:hypothetical protein E4U57_004146 [Claviceps arundinis]|uniref:Uncharacterized protein n=1 Tax=Claviceps arundinis TaxID=1623583 RepID=A0A9P7SLF4_9HYPO|nr:hypothetical protein E4U57_004146 [Claviceps arundinis]KAG5959450.1 hypothetical protein E4U56_004982 [Claviceps arundinis]
MIALAAQGSIDLASTSFLSSLASMAVVVAAGQWVEAAVLLTSAAALLRRANAVVPISAVNVIELGASSLELDHLSLDFLTGLIWYWTISFGLYSYSSCW